MILDLFHSRLFLSLLLIVLGLMMTIDIIIFSLENSTGPDEEHDYYLDDDGNHAYYERSIIEKNEFTRRHPSVPASHLRTFRRLFTF